MRILGSDGDNQAGRMGQPVKALAAKSDNPSSKPDFHIVERTDFKLFSDLHIHEVTHACPPMQQ